MIFGKRSSTPKPTLSEEERKRRKREAVISVIVVVVVVTTVIIPPFFEQFSQLLEQLPRAAQVLLDLLLPHLGGHRALERVGDPVAVHIQAPGLAQPLPIQTSRWFCLPVTAACR